MERVLHHDDGGRLDPFLVTEKTRELDRRFVGFASGIAKESIVHRREIAQAGSELLLLGNFVKVGYVHRACSLGGNCGDQPGVGMSHTVDGDPADAVEVAPALEVPQP